MMDKRKLKMLMGQEGKLKVYSEQDLIKPISKLLMRQDYFVPIGNSSNSDSGQVIFKNLIEQYFLDFLGIDESQSSVPKIMNPTTGELLKDYSQEFYDQKLKVPYRTARPIFKSFESNSTAQKFFEGSPESDFIYAMGDRKCDNLERNMRVNPMEFFSKYINTKEEKNDSEFMFIRYAAEFGSLSGFKDPNGMYSFASHFDKPSLENNIYYSKIKYFEDGENSFVYVENRRLSIIKKRYFMNLTVRMDYYNNLLTSLAYPCESPCRFESPMRIINRQFYNGNFWGNSYNLSFNSTKEIEHNPTIFEDIKNYDEEDYLVFDNLDFSYNKNGDVSKSYAITAEGMYTVVRKKGGQITLINPKDELTSLNNIDGLVKGINVAVKPVFDSYREETDGSCRTKRFKDSFIESSERKDPINYLFGVLANQSCVGVTDSMKIKQSSIYAVLRRIYESKAKSTKSSYQRPKNSSKLALDPKKDEVQILADHLASGHKNVYNDFLKNSYKVTLSKLKRAFQCAPNFFHGTKEDFKNGNAIHLGGGMYLKLVKYYPNETMSLPYDPRRSLRSTEGEPDFIKINKAYTYLNQIKVTLSWLLVTCYELYEKDNGQKIDLNTKIRSVCEYLESLSGSPSSPANSYTLGQKLESAISFNYGDRNGMYALNYKEFDPLETNDIKKNSKLVDNIAGNKHGKIINCEPLFEPTQYKLIAKDKSGNVAYSIVRPFISVDLQASGAITTVELSPSIPMHNFIFYAPKLSEDSKSREVFSVHIHSSRNNELVNYVGDFKDPLPAKRGDVAHGNVYEFMAEYQSVLNEQQGSIHNVARNPLATTSRDLLTGSLSTEKHPRMASSEYMVAPYFTEVWYELFKKNPSKFFKDYKTPDILFSEVGGEYEKIKRGDVIKNYFKGTAWEVLRIDAWLGIRPADKNNLNLYHPEHWVNQRVLLDYEFLLYMLSVLVGGAYQLTTIVEGGMDTKELNFETYDDRLYENISFHPHLRGPYGVAVLHQDFYGFNLSATLSYFAGCFAAKRTVSEANASSRGFERFADTSYYYGKEEDIQPYTMMALMGIRDGSISTYANFVAESFDSLVSDKTKKEKKSIRSRLHKFFMSEDYMKSALITASQAVIETIAIGADIGTDLLTPVENLQQEIGYIRRKSDCGSTELIRLFREVFTFPLFTDETLDYSVNEIFRYLKSLVTEQRASRDISNAATIYKSYLGNLYAIKEHGKVDLQNRKVVFPEALKTQADIVAYNRELIKSQEELARFQKGCSQYKMMEYSNNKYAIRMAKSPLELQLEGTNLGHCVGTYADLMMAGTNIIFFLREKGNHEKSNITVEFIPHTGSMSNLSAIADFNGDNLEFYMRGHINQVQGMSRRPVNREEALFLNEWRSFVQSQMRKKTNIIPSLGKKNKVKIRYEFTFGSSIQNQLHVHFIDRPPVA